MDTDMSFDVSRFVYWTGVYNMGLTIAVALSAAGPILGVRFCSPAWALLIAGFLAFTAVVLIISSRNLTLFAPLVFWEAILRFVAFAVIVPFGLFGDIGIMGAVLGLGDLVIGLGYLYGLTKCLGFSYADLFWARNTYPPT
jgi:hypothetical protein